MGRTLLVVLFACATATVAVAQRAPAEPPLDSLHAWARRDSLDAQAYFALGMGYWSKKRFDQADSAFRRAMTLAPSFAEPRLAMALLPYGRPDRYLSDIYNGPNGRDSLIAVVRQSARYYREAYLSDPLVDPRILRYLGIDALVPRVNRIEAANGIIFSLGVPWWEGRTRRGVKALVEGRPEEAFTALDEVIKSRQIQEGAVLPDMFVWYYGIAAAHAAKYDRSAAAFRELAQRAHRRQEADPDWVLPTARADYLYFYAVMSEQAGNVGVAIPALGEALAADLGLFQAHSRLADIHEARGQVDDAIAERQRAVDTSPETGQLELDLGVTLLQAGRPIPAESAFVRAATLLPNDAGALQFLARTAMQNGNPAVARPALERFLLVAPARYEVQKGEARSLLAQLP